jgi:hypothetical protein
VNSNEDEKKAILAKEKAESNFIEKETLQESMLKS